MALTGNEYIVRNGLVLSGLDELTSNPGKYLSVDSDNKAIYRTGASVLSDITSGLTSGYIPVRSSSTLVNSNIYIDGSKVGVNTASPDGTFHIITGSAGSVTANSNAADLVVESNDDGGISILVPDDADGGIYFGNASSNHGASVRWSKPSKILSIGTNLALGKTQILSGAGVVGIILDGSQDVTFDGLSYKLEGLLQTDINGKISVKEYARNGSNYDLTITSPKTVSSNTWEEIEFELPAELAQDVQGQYDEVNSLFRIFDGETWLFNLAVSIAPTADAQYIEVQMYDTSASRAISTAVIVINGTEYYQSVCLSGIGYGNGAIKPIVFRVRSNRQFDIRHDTVNSSFKGTCLVATRQGIY